MNRNRTIALSLFVIAVFIMTSCAIAPHPNEKIIVGIWKPIKVEKIVDSSALLAAGVTPSDTARKVQKTGKTTGNGDGSRKAAGVDRLVQSEMRATLEVFANKTAIKNYPGKPLHATWKMKGRGTRLVTVNVANKSKFVIDIVEISQDRVVVVEHAPAADIKITYDRQK
jgi:hypothetical protein